MKLQKVNTNMQHNILFELNLFTNTHCCETKRTSTPGFTVYCLFHIHTIILHSLRAGYYYLLLFSHPTFPLVSNFVDNNNTRI